MKLIEHMPPFLRDVREFIKIFDAEDEVIKNLDIDLKSLLTEVIVRTANSYGLDRYEKIYNISNISSNVEIRRINILNKINDRVPFTYKWLYNKLKEALGEGNFNLICEDYSLTIIIYGLKMEIADIYRENLRQQLPANIAITFNLRMNSNYYIGANVVQKEYNTMKIDNSITKEKVQITADRFEGLSIIQKEFMTLYINNDVIVQKEMIEENQSIGSAIIQKESMKLLINNDTILQNESINGINYNATKVVQKEYLKLKEE